MALDKSKVDGLLIDFVVRNQSDLQSNQKENPALYDAVLSALSVLARKFGSGQVLADPVPASFYTDPEPDVIPSNPLNFEIGDIFFREGISSKKFYISEIDSEKNNVKVGYLEQGKPFIDFNLDEVLYNFDKEKWIKTGDKFIPPKSLNFEIGDVFDRKGANGIKFFIKQINIESDEVLIANLENENDVSDYSIGEVENKFKKRIWVKTGDKFMPLPNKPASKPMYFKVGDVFYTKGYKDIKYYIFSIDKQANDVLVGSVSGAFSGTTRYDLDEANRYMNDGTWVFTGEIQMPPSTPAANTNNGRFVIKPKTVAKSAPPPPATVPAAIKKTAAKTKKAVSPEEKELLDAIKTLKPLAGLDPDIQKEIDELNVKLTSLRNKKD